MKYLKRFNESSDEKFELLRDKLLQRAGDRVVDTYEEDIDKLLERGIFFNHEPQLIKMRDSRCHFNSSNFWKNYSEANGLGDAHIVTGWALSSDGLWRQHSWIWLKNTDEIVETTVERELYYGFILTDEEAEEFYWNNY